MARARFRSEIPTVIARIAVARSILLFFDDSKIPGAAGYGLLLVAKVPPSQSCEHGYSRRPEVVVLSLSLTRVAGSSGRRVWMNRESEAKHLSSSLVAEAGAPSSSCSVHRGVV